MDRGQSIGSPLLQRSDVVEKRMEMVAMLLKRVNEEANLGQTIESITEDRGNNHVQLPQIKGWLPKKLNALFFGKQT